MATTCKLQTGDGKFWKRAGENGETTNEQLDGNTNLHIFPEQTHISWVQ